MRIADFELEIGGTVISLSTFIPVLLSAVCIGIIVLLINSSYGRAFKAIRENEIAAEAMGINLARHKMLSFCISSFFAGVAGAGMAMVLGIAQANNFKSAMTYEILLMVVLGGRTISQICQGRLAARLPADRGYSRPWSRITPLPLRTRRNRASRWITGADVRSFFFRQYFFRLCGGISCQIPIARIILFNFHFFHAN